MIWVLVIHFKTDFCTAAFHDMKYSAFCWIIISLGGGGFKKLKKVECLSCGPTGPSQQETREAEPLKHRATEGGPAVTKNAINQSIKFLWQHL